MPSDDKFSVEDLTANHRTSTFPDREEVFAMPERIIVNYGVYQFTEEEKQAYRLRLLVKVIRQPTNKYESLKPQKPESFYGYAQLMNGNYVHNMQQLRFTEECCYEWINDKALDTLEKYSNQVGLGIALQNVVNDLGGTPSDVIVNEARLYPLPYDRVVFKLHGNTTIAVLTEVFPLPVFEGVIPAWDETYDDPSASTDTQPEANPEDPPYDIPSAPYDDLTDDDGETYSPVIPEPPLTGDTGMYRFTITCRYLVNFDTGATSTLTQQYDIPAPVSRPQKSVSSDSPSGYAISATNYYGPQNTLADWCTASYAGSITSQQKQQALETYQIISYSAVQL